MQKIVQKFIEYCRTTNSRYGRGTNAQRMAVNTISAGVMSTPPRTPPRIPGDSNTQQRSTRSTGNIPVRGLLGFWVYHSGLITSWKSAESLEEQQRMNLTPRSTFWDQGDIGKRSPTMCGKDFAMTGYLTVLMFLTYLRRMRPYT